VVLEGEIVVSAGLLHSSRYRVITALAAYDRCGHRASSGARTCAHWLADRFGISVGAELLRYDHQPGYDIIRHTHTDELVRRCPHCHRERHKT
jgi:hypothetical protein